MLYADRNNPVGRAKLMLIRKERKNGWRAALDYQREKGKRKCKQLRHIWPQAHTLLPQ